MDLGHVRVGPYEDVFVLMRTPLRASTSSSVKRELA